MNCDWQNTNTISLIKEVIQPHHTLLELKGTYDHLVQCPSKAKSCRTPFHKTETLINPLIHYTLFINPLYPTIFFFFLTAFHSGALIALEIEM